MDSLSSAIICLIWLIIMTKWNSSNSSSSSPKGFHCSRGKYNLLCFLFKVEPTNNRCYVMSGLGLRLLWEYQLTVSKFSYSKDRFLVNDHLFDVCKIWLNILKANQVCIFCWKCPWFDSSISNCTLAQVCLHTWVLIRLLSVMSFTHLVGWIECGCCFFFFFFFFFKLAFSFFFFFFLE